MANDVTITVGGQDRSGSAFDSAISNEKKLERATESLSSMGRKASETLTKGLKSIGKEADDSGQKTEKFGSRFKNAIHDQAQQGTDGLLGKLGQVGAVLGKLGPVGIAAGAAIGAGLAVAALAAGKLKEAFDIALARDTSNRKLGAQLGLDPEQMKMAGKVAGEVYADNFGESIQSINDVIKSVIQNMTGVADMGKDSVKKMTEEITVLMTTTGEDAAALTRAASQLIRTGLVDDATQAFDLIQKGAQIGADKAGDLLDTFNEYGTQFRKLGLDGTTALGLIDQAIKAGARDSDIAADALKEFAIRAVDGSATTADGFKKLGLSHKQMAEDIAAGGSRANKALDTTLDRLRAVKDPVERARLAVELFGTQAEDLGAALYAMNVDTASDQMKDLEGATKRASDTLGGGLQASIDTAKRKFETLKAELGEKLMPIVQYFIDNVWPKFAEALQLIGDKFAQVWKDHGPMLIGLLETLKQLWDDNKESIAKLKPFLEYLGIFLGVTLVAALVVVGGLIGLFITYLGKVGDTLSGAKKGMDIFAVNMLTWFGRILDGAAVAFGWIPGIGPKIKAAQKAFHEAAGRIISDIEGIPEQKLVDVRIRLSGLAAAHTAIANIANAAAGVQVGLGHRASGGIGGGLTEVGERGRELVRLPQGSMVYPAANANQMSSSGGRSETVIRIEGPSGDWLYEAMKQGFRLGKVRIYSSSIVPG